MTFQKKIFVSLVLLSGILTILLTFLGVFVLKQLVTEEKKSTTESTVKFFAQAVEQYEKGVEMNMLNAARYVRSKVGTQVPNTSELIDLAKETNITHIFIVDSKGNFIRSTNEDPSLIPNLFSFCENYKLLLDPNVDLAYEATPVIPPEPEPHPYKFLTIASVQKLFFIHLGLKADYIEDFLSKLVALNPSSIYQVDFYTPSGISLGSYSSRGMTYTRHANRELKLASSGFTYLKNHWTYNFWMKTPHPNCCQCETAGDLSIDGEYEYLLKAHVDVSDLNAQTRNIYLGGFLILILLLTVATFLSNFIAKRIVRRVAELRHKVLSFNIASDSKFDGLSNAGDELDDLSQSFSSLVENLRDFYSIQDEINRKQSLIELARQVSHDIRSPLAALKIIFNQSDFPSDQRELAKDALKRVSDISMELVEKNIAGSASNKIVVGNLTKKIIEEKKVSYPNAVFNLKLNIEDVLIWGQEVAFLRILSNLINNAIDAYRGLTTVTKVDIYIDYIDKSRISITIQDYGAGISEDKLKLLGKVEVTSEKEDGFGIGVKYCAHKAREWGGDLSISSQEGIGTTVILSFNVA